MIESRWSVPKFGWCHVISTTKYLDAGSPILPLQFPWAGQALKTEQLSITALLYKGSSTFVWKFFLFYWEIFVLTVNFCAVLFASAAEHMCFRAPLLSRGWCLGQATPSVIFSCILISLCILSGSLERLGKLIKHYLCNSAEPCLSIFYLVSFFPHWVAREEAFWNVFYHVLKYEIFHVQEILSLVKEAVVDCSRCSSC